MSMGYDYDDPRREAMLQKLDAGVWKLQTGDKPVTRRTAMPDRIASAMGKGKS